MSHPVRKQAQVTPSCQLLRKSSLLKKVAFSKSTLHAKMTVGGPYHDPDFPLPFYFPKSRVPMWRESEVDAWIAKSVERYRQDSRGTPVEAMPGLEPSPPVAGGPADAVPDTQHLCNEPSGAVDMAASREAIAKAEPPSALIDQRKPALAISKPKVLLSHPIRSGFSNSALQERAPQAEAANPQQYLAGEPVAQPRWMQGAEPAPLSRGWWGRNGNFDI
ncbi:MAG: AlpA family phage regulatory protein [Aquabacterium sp.]|uniref:helix-turn-helix transcriptional regulator n=1 Tax=Aquabacterium sp. TaxID=1872578 RepID=UPI00120ABCBE|nr:AlpA family phage regulatory protein [Aquabacterium sp.]TAK92911.1 MAG: AlpA family phage regulatory protein [Aquabacterium sp.]